MTLIKEPEGIDFVIKSKPLSGKEQKALSKFIIEYKEKHSDKNIVKKRVYKKVMNQKKVNL